MDDEEEVVVVDDDGVRSVDMRVPCDDTGQRFSCCGTFKPFVRVSGYARGSFSNSVRGFIRNIHVHSRTLTMCPKTT